MKTKAKQNGMATKESLTSKKEVQQKLTRQAVGKTSSPEKGTDKKPITTTKPIIPQKQVISIEGRIQQFEKLKGLATQRERLNQTLSELRKFNYNQDGSSTFYLRDAHNLEFKTGNTNLIKIVTAALQSTLEERLAEIEGNILQFEL